MRRPEHQPHVLQNGALAAAVAQRQGRMRVLLAAVALLLPAAQAFYLPGVAPMDFAKARAVGLPGAVGSWRCTQRREGLAVCPTLQGRRTAWLVCCLPCAPPVKHRP